MKSLTPVSVTLMMFVVVGLLVAAYFVKSLLATKEPPPRVETRNVPMAVADLEPGTVVTDAHLGLGPMRVAQQTSEMLVSDRVIIGRVVKERILKATPILASQLYPPGEFPSLKVGDGMRAVSINVVGSAAIVDGLIKPGEYVDVHFTPRGSIDARIRNGLTLTLLKGVRVIAINRNYSPSVVNNGGGNTVTLELTAKEANVVLLSQDRGMLNLTYTPEGRGSDGIALANEDRVFLDEILGLTPLENPEPPFVVEMYRGPSLTTLEFQDGRRFGSSRSDNDPTQPRTQPGDVPVPSNPSAPTDATDPNGAGPGKNPDPGVTSPQLPATAI